jgi:hypothetical protein
MTTATYRRRANGRAGGGYGFRTVARMEWHKLRTVRSTWYVVAGFAASMVGLAVLALSHENYAQLSAADRASFDPARDSFIGLVLGQLLVGHPRGARDHGRVLLRDDPRHLRRGAQAGARAHCEGSGARGRHTAGAICALVGALFVLSLLFAPLSPSIQQFLPNAMRNSLTSVKPVPDMLSPGSAFGLMCAYAAVALAAGAWVLTRRDA